MSEPAIKLFGKTIPVLEIAAVSGGEEPLGAYAPDLSSYGSGSAEECIVENRPFSSSSPGKDESGRVEEKPQVVMESLWGKEIETKQGDGALPLASEELTYPDTSSVANANPIAKLPSSRPEEEHSEASVSQQKPLKKPDKILPCPRCNSMETKFCYYNNYNVNQPRHFCKNCQRYWTAGGTMRNVPIGAGRRKSKNLPSHYRHITVSAALQNCRNDNHPLKTNGTVLAFGSDIPLCESVASALNLTEKTTRSCMPNRFHKPEELRVPFSSGGIHNGNDQVSGSVVTGSNSKDEAEEPVMQNNGFNPPQMPYLPGGASWPCAWNAANWSSPVSPPAFYPAGYSMPFYPAYWGCTVPGTWNVPWWLLLPSSPDYTSPPSSGPNSPTLGKHSRDENLLKSTNSGEEEEPLEGKKFENFVLVPKTLRIDDPGEAAKSIWATLGIKNDKVDSLGGRGLFKGFQSKDNEKSCVGETPPMLQANPAALSRWQKFQERS